MKMISAAVILLVFLLSGCPFEPPPFDNPWDPANRQGRDTQQEDSLADPAPVFLASIQPTHLGFAPGIYYPDLSTYDSPLDWIAILDRGPDGTGSYHTFEVFSWGGGIENTLASGAGSDLEFALTGTGPLVWFSMDVIPEINRVELLMNRDGETAYMNIFLEDGVNHQAGNPQPGNPDPVTDGSEAVITALYAATAASVTDYTGGAFAPNGGIELWYADSGTGTVIVPGGFSSFDRNPGSYEVFVIDLEESLTGNSIFMQIYW